MTPAWIQINIDSNIVVHVISWPPAFPEYLIHSLFRRGATEAWVYALTAPSLSSISIIFAFYVCSAVKIHRFFAQSYPSVKLIYKDIGFWASHAPLLQKTVRICVTDLPLSNPVTYMNEMRIYNVLSAACFFRPVIFNQFIRSIRDQKVVIVEGLVSTSTLAISW